MSHSNTSLRRYRSEQARSPPKICIYMGRLIKLNRLGAYFTMHYAHNFCFCVIHGRDKNVTRFGKKTFPCYIAHFATDGVICEKSLKFGKQSCLQSDYLWSAKRHKSGSSSLHTRTSGAGLAHVTARFPLSMIYIFCFVY